MVTVADRIKMRRQKLGMSQEDLAKKLGYKSRSTIAKIENGENDITQSKIAAFAKALQTTPKYLMGWTVEAGIASRIDKILKTKFIGEDTWENIGYHGISYERMEDFANERTIPSANDIHYIAYFFGVDENWILKGDTKAQPTKRYYDDPEVVALAETLRTDPGRKILFDATKNLSKEDVEMVLGIIKRLKEKGNG